MVAQLGTIVQLRRGTSTQMSVFTPAQGEFVADVTSYRGVIGDGITAGGFPVSRAGLTTLINSSVYTVLPTDVHVIFTVLSTAVTHTITLPSALNYPIGQELVIGDGSTQGAGSTNPIVIAPSASSNAFGFDTINASTATISIVLANQKRSLITNGSSGWIAWST